MKTLFVLVALFCSVNSIVYITPKAAVNDMCLMHNTSVSCYQLHQVNETLLQSIGALRQVVFHLLPGHHELRAQQRFTVSDKFYVELSSTVENEAEISCVGPPHSLELLNIQNVRVSFLKFNGCTLICAHSSEYRDHSFGALILTACSFMDVQGRALITVSLDNIFISNCQFTSCNGAMHCVCTSFSCRHSRSSVQILNSTFSSNKASSYGGALYIDGTNLELSGSSFTENSATKGGAIYSTSSVVAENMIFNQNIATISGGAIHMKHFGVDISHSQFTYNRAGSAGGALHFFSTSSSQPISITNSTFTYNEATDYGGAISCMGDSSNVIPGVVIRGGYSKFNAAKYGGFVYLSRFLLILDGTYFISNNSAFANGGAVYAKRSQIDIGGRCIMSYNRANDAGGALYLDNFSCLSLNHFDNEDVLLHFHSNTVLTQNGRGGAIFVRDRDCESLTQEENECFLRSYLPETQNTSQHTTSLVFSKNMATYGSVLFGGLLDRCLPPKDTSPGPQIYYSGLTRFKEIAQFEEGYRQVSSRPLKVQVFNVTSYLYYNTAFATQKMRGETVQVTIGALDQDNNLVPAIIRASYQELTAQLGKGESRREISNQWEVFTYHIFTAWPSYSAILQIEPEGPCRSSVLSSVTIFISIIPCHFGFEEHKDRCVCDRRLTTYLNITTCYLETLSVKRVGPIWFQFGEKHLKMHTHCPLDYCQVSSDTISITQPDQQCAGSRSGVLCGACLANHSAVLGTSTCLKCSSSPHNFLWLTILFATAGLALVALLMICNITVSAGTLQGFIFYVNVISMSGLTSLSNCSIHPLLSVFIAWANLELGVRTCFFPGMDTYQKTWLQFCFPLYIWCLVTAIAVASHYSSKAMRLFGRNNIAILATLFLLSYSKILKTIVTTLSFTDISVSEAGEVTAPVLTERVWTADANVEYRGRKHSALLAVALLFLLVLFLPYTLLLTFGQCVRKVTSRRRGLRWVHSTAFVSVMDAYHAPYNRRHRYWTGLLLLTRCLLVLLFSTAHRESVLLANMYAVAVVVTGLLVIKTFTTRIYRKPLASYLELAFLLNLEILSCTLCYLKAKENGGDVICKVLSASIGVSFTLCVCVLMFHTYLRLSRFRSIKLLREKLSLVFENWQKGHQINKKGNESTTTSASSRVQPHTTTTVELREPLLDD